MSFARPEAFFFNGAARQMRWMWYGFAGTQPLIPRPIPHPAIVSKNDKDHLLLAEPIRCILTPGLKTELSIAAYAPIAPIRAHKYHGVSLNPKMLHVRTGQSGSLSWEQLHGKRESPTTPISA